MQLLLGVDGHAVRKNSKLRFPNCQMRKTNIQTGNLWRAMDIASPSSHQVTFYSLRML